VKRSHGSGHLYVKWGSYYEKWRGYDGRLVNQKIGKVRTRGEKNGLTRAEAERALRRLVEADATQDARPVVERPKSVDEAANALRERLELEGIRPSYRRNLESMQRVHVSPALGDRRADSVRREDIERLARAMARRCRRSSPQWRLITATHNLLK